MTMMASVGEMSVQAMGLDELGVRRLAREARESRQVRSDALPEHLDYRDDGCDMFPSCLSCPLPRCRYDVPGGVRAMLNQERDHQIRVLREDAGLSVDDIAGRFQVSRRTVFRALSTPNRRTERTAS
jgi:hypothetical protein